MNFATGIVASGVWTSDVETPTFAIHQLRTTDVLQGMVRDCISVSFASLSMHRSVRQKMNSFIRFILLQRNIAAF